MGLISDNYTPGPRGRIRTLSQSSTTSKLAGVANQKNIDYVTNTSPGGDQEGIPQVKVIQNKQTALREKIIKTAILYSGVLFLGLQWGIIGPSLPDMEELTSGSTTHIALILTGRNIASLTGSITAGVVIDKYNNWLLLGGAQFLLGSMFALAPSSNKIQMLAAFLIPSGVAAGFYDTGVNVAVLNVWISKPGPWIQAMECIDAIGSFLAPLLAQPFLLKKPTNQLQPEGEFLLNLTEADQSDSSANGTVHIFVAKSRVAFAYLVVGVLLIAAGAAHLFIFFQERCQIRISRERPGAMADKPASKSSSEGRRAKILLFPLLFTICFAYYSLETGYAHYLTTFCVKHLSWTKARSVTVTSAFWAFYTTGTAVGIIVIKYVRPRLLLLCDVTLCLISQVVLNCFVDLHSSVIWACAMAAGLSISTIFASIFSWTERNIGVNGRVNALLMVGIATGEMASPAIIGVLIDRSGAISWAYCMLASAMLCMMAFLLMHAFASKLKATKDNMEIAVTAGEKGEKQMTALLDT